MKEFFTRLAARPVVLVELLGASLLINVLGLASTLYVIQVLNRYVAFGVDGTLMTLGSGLVIAALIEFALRQMRHKLATAVSARRDWKLAMSTFETMARARPWLLARMSPAAQQEVVRGLDTVQQAYNAPNVTAVLDVPFAILFIVVLYLLSPAVAILATIVVSIALLVAMRRSFTARATARALVGSTGTARALIATALHNGETVRAFNACEPLLDVWRTARFKMHQVQDRLHAEHGFTLSLHQLLSILMTGGVIALGAKLVVAGELSVGALIGANILAARALTPVTQFARLIETFAGAQQANRMLREFIRLPAESRDGKTLPGFEGGIEFRDVGFGHPGDVGPLFESLSFRVDPGGVMVVSGANGTGKTSFARMIVGLLEPERGQIIAGGVELRQIEPDWWRRQVSYVPQEPTFLNGSIAENIRVNAPELTPDGLDRVIAEADLQGYLNTKPKGADTVITDHGRHMPVGIRRRLALARALATDGRIFILDEPTEGLDDAGSQRVYAVLNQLAEAGRTLIIASHDPSIVRGAQLMLDLNIKPVPRLIIHSDRPALEVASAPHTAIAKLAEIAS
jgi:ATP-binding cassette subfamily C protein LapB